MDKKPELYELLRTKGFRITKPKKAILDVFLANRNKMLSVGDVFELLPAGCGVDQATVYRNIRKFQDADILESMVDSRGTGRYTIREKKHHHYLICTECGRIVKFPCSNHYWDAVAAENGFEETHHKLEVYGKCADCKDHGAKTGSENGIDK